MDTEGRPGGDHLFLTDGQGHPLHGLLGHRARLRRAAARRRPEPHRHRHAPGRTASAPWSSRSRRTASPRRSPAAARQVPHEPAQGRRRRLRASAPRTSRPTRRCRTCTRSRRSATSTPRAARRSPASSASRATVGRLDELLGARPRHHRHLHALGPAPGAGDRRARGGLPRRRREAGRARASPRSTPSPPPRPRRPARSARSSSTASATACRSCAPDAPRASPAAASVATAETHWYRGEVYYGAAAWRGTFDGELGGCLTTHAIHIHDMLCEMLGADRLGARPHLQPAQPQRDRGHGGALARLRLRRLRHLLGHPRLAPGDVAAALLLRRPRRRERPRRPTTPATIPGRFPHDDPAAAPRIAAALEDFAPLPERFVGQFHRLHARPDRRRRRCR